MSQQEQKLITHVKAAGRYARMQFRQLRRSNIYEKSRIERVTSVDKYIHRRLSKNLPKIFPAPVLSEEGSKRWKKCSTYWVVDPIDGTTNYITRIPFFCIGVGLVINNVITLNAVYNPMLDEMFFASRGKGAFLNTKKLRKDHALPLAKSIIGISYSHTPSSIQRAGRIGMRLRKTVHNTRHTGSTLLTFAYVAAGRLEASIVIGPATPWDTIPALLLIEEVNGIISDFKGKPYQLMKSKNIIASNGAKHTRLMHLIASIR